MLRNRWVRWTVGVGVKVLGAQVGRRLALSRDPKARKVGRIFQRVWAGLNVADAGWDAYVVLTL